MQKRKLYAISAAAILSIAGASVAMPTPVGRARANSAPYSWRGAAGSAVITVGECPLTVVGERLAFDIADTPKAVYESARKAVRRIGFARKLVLIFAARSRKSVRRKFHRARVSVNHAKTRRRNAHVRISAVARRVLGAIRHARYRNSVAAANKKFVRRARLRKRRLHRPPRRLTANRIDLYDRCVRGICSAAERTARPHAFNRIRNMGGDCRDVRRRRHCSARKKRYMIFLKRKTRPSRSGALCVLSQILFVVHYYAQLAHNVH